MTCAAPYASAFRDMGVVRTPEIEADEVSILAGVRHGDDGCARGDSDWKPEYPGGNSHECRPCYSALLIDAGTTDERGSAA